MTDRDSRAWSFVRTKAGRRRILAGLGASGLAAAAATFTRGTPALAADEGCCGLAHPPGTSGYVSYSYCQAHHSYIWNCSIGTRDCACCETKNDAQSGFVCVRAG
jgi:hypothetical protein